ncbi:DDE-domain-containing protein, partial [Wilcoxina mikolae CBS 423.85]
WLVNVYDSYSKQHCPAETRLLILDGYGSHITADFIDYCKNNNIAVYYLPPNSTHLLQSLDVSLFAPLQNYYGKAIEDHFLTTDISVNHDTFFPLIKQSHKIAYTKETIENTFRGCSIVLLHSKVVMDKLQAPTTSLNNLPTLTLERTPYTKCELRQQTAWM